MSLKVKSKIVVPNIEIKIDQDNEYGAKQIIEQWGKNIPIIRINDYVVPVGNINSYDVYIDINSMLKFNINVMDDANFIRDSFKSNTLNKAIIFIGNENWYHKYEGVILDTDSNDKNDNIYIDGIIYAPKLFNSEQKKYNENSIDEILTEISNESDIGYYNNSNESLNFKIPEIINPNICINKFIDTIIKKFTNNIWSFDNNYILHVGNLESFINKPVSKVNYFANHKLPKEINLTLSNNLNLNVDEENLDEDFLNSITAFGFSKYSIDDRKISIFNKEYSILDEESNEKKLYVNDYGFGNKTDNYFSGFKNKFFPNYVDIVNKQLTGKVITIIMDNNFYEIHPFMTLNLDLFTHDKKLTKNKIKNEVDSGKKILIGYSYHYQKNKNKITQKIKLI